MDRFAYHRPVLLRETLELLLTDLNGIYVDGTLGGGGHAEAILEQLGAGGTFIGIDQDDDALAAARTRLKRFGNRVLLSKSNYSRMGSILSGAASGKAAGILLDLGVSSHQLDAAEKGFSFRADAPLDMRMDQHGDLTAAAVVNGYTEERLANVIWEYGEERNSRRIARAIGRARAGKPLATTQELSAVVEQAVGGRFLTKSLARVFQAIRMEVNDELSHLRRGLAEGIALLQSGGRMVVLSYHSLEDRIVKETFRSLSAETERPSHLLLPDIPLTPVVRPLTKKPIVPTGAEAEENPRARSAKLRAVEKI